MEQTAILKAAEIIAAKTGNKGYCTLALMDSDGYPTAATISVSKADGIRWVTFCSGVESNWARRACACNRASICFNSDNPLYNITLVGTLEVLTNLPTKQEMWYKGMSYYFSGPEDPGFCVLRFNTQRYSLLLSEVEGNIRGTL